MTYDPHDPDADGVPNFPAIDIQSHAAQISLDGVLSVVTSQGGTPATSYVNPANTSTPVQDAVDLIANHGRVILPPQIVDEQTTVDIPTEVEIVGWGIGGGHAGGDWNVGSAIRILDPDVDCLTVGANGNSHGNRLDGFQVIGPSRPGNGVSSGAGLRILSNMARGYIGNVKFGDLTDAAIWTDSGDLVECRFDLVSATAIDAAQSGRAVYELSSSGWSSSIGVLAAYPDSHMSGSMSTCLNVGGVGNLDISVLNFGGALGPAIIENGGDGAVRIGVMNYEPHGYEGQNAAVIVYSYGNQNFHLGPTTIRGGAAYNYFVRIDGAGNNYFSSVTANGSVSHNTAYQVRVVSDTSAPNIYQGVSADVNNGSGGGLSYPISCLGDLTTVG